MTDAVKRKLQQELDELDQELRVELPKQIKTAKEWGDLRENAEYHAALARGKRGVMVSLQAANIRTVPLAEAVADLKTVPPESQLVRTARDVGISFGAPDEDSFHQTDGRNQL